MSIELGGVLALEPGHYERLAEAARHPQPGAAFGPPGRERPKIAAPAGVALAELHGLITPRGGPLDFVYGGTSLERLTAELEGYVNDRHISAIVLSIVSPGGSVFLVEETTDRIRALAGQKPIVGVLEFAASASYWCASACSELVISPSGQCGSIGVIVAHTDLSGAAEKAGIKTTFVSAPRNGFKSEGNAWEPLGDEARDHEQQVVDAYYARFVNAVARGRGVSTAAVMGEGFGRGRMVLARQAVAAGMADRIGTLRQVVGELAANVGTPSRSRVAVGGSLAAAQQLALAKLALVEASLPDTRTPEARKRDAEFDCAMAQLRAIAAGH